MLEYKVEINEGAVTIIGTSGIMCGIINVPKFINGCPVVNIRCLRIASEEATQVVIPNSVTEISDVAFSAWEKLESITIPNSVVNIGKHALCCCSSLKYINNIEIINDFCVINDRFQYKNGLISKMI